MPDTTIIGFFDGCCEPRNPGGSIGIGCVLYECQNPDLRSGSISIGDDAKEIFRYSQCFHKGERNFVETSNNVAEYCACLMLLDYIRKNDIKKQPIILCGDSKLVVEQMNGNWSMNKGIYIPYAKKLMEALIGYPNILFRWISRDYNNIADELSKSQMKARGVKFKIQPQ